MRNFHWNVTRRFMAAHAEAFYSRSPETKSLSPEDKDRLQRRAQQFARPFGRVLHDAVENEYGIVQLVKLLFAPLRQATRRADLLHAAYNRLSRRRHLPLAMASNSGPHWPTLTYQIGTLQGAMQRVVPRTPRYEEEFAQAIQSMEEAERLMAKGRKQFNHNNLIKARELFGQA